MPELLGNMLRMPMRMRRPTQFDKLAGKGFEELKTEAEVNQVQMFIDQWHQVKM